MTLILELDETTEARLRAEAEARGLAVEAYAGAVLRNSAPVYATGNGRPTRESFQEMLHEMAKGSENRPVLPPEAFERESFYGDRG
jgi:hypothetical protein